MNLLTHRYGGAALRRLPNHEHTKVTKENPYGNRLVPLRVLRAFVVAARIMRALATFELTKDYAVGFWRKRPYRALDRLTLDVEAGEVFGFLGPNGAGKTTTLKLLMQLVFPTAGRAEILGRPLGDLAVKRRIGYLPENPYFYDYLTAEELLELFRGLVRLSRPASAAHEQRGCSTRSASAPNGGCSCASSRRACCSASASRRRSSTIRSW